MTRVSESLAGFTATIAITGVLLTAGIGAHPARSSASGDAARANDNRTAAGALTGNVFTIALELRSATWLPNGDSGIALRVQAFGEAGREASIPGPLLRVPSGTEMHVSIHNLLDVRAVVRGLRDHDGTDDSLVLAAGETRVVQFTARTVGTHFYFAHTTAATTAMSLGADAQLAGAFIVDSPSSRTPGAVAHDRVFVITAWEDTLKDPRLRYGRRRLFAINGLSWPHTERLSYSIGDTVRWRVVNASQHGHPMHLHGFYFSVLSRGSTLDDTLYDAADRRNAVTEVLAAGTTMSVQWTADRAGNWLFHCHFINHVDTDLRLADSRQMAMSSTSASHFANSMAGLVMAIVVRDTGATRRVNRADPPRTRLRLFVSERESRAPALPSYSFVLQQGTRAPASDSMRIPGSTIYLHQNEPTEITVINRSSHATAVHWHGMELESYYDGVAGWSGADAHSAPLIAPGDSFVVRLTPPRAGTFIYHTHADDLTQLTGGLYGALIVLPAHAQPDISDRLVIFSDSSAADMRETPPSLVNGSSVPAPIALCTGVSHRIRFIGISAVTGRRLRFLDDSTLVQWTPVAKDGQELPRAQQVARSAATRIAPGETMDFAFTPPHAGGYTLEVMSVYGTARVTRVPVTATACGRAAVNARIGH